MFNYKSNKMRKLKTIQPNTQMPINQASLMHQSFFIDYCKDNGAQVDERVLEELHKFGLVYPALKIYLGVVKFKKIYAIFDGKEDWRYVNFDNVNKFKFIKLDKKTYYGVGNLSKFNNHWLDYYFKNDMAEYPSQSKFFKWTQKKYPGFYTDSKLISKQYQFLYDKKQISVIKMALPYLRSIRTYDPDLKKVVVESIQKRIADLYKFFDIYHDMEKLYILFLEMKRKKILELKNSKSEGEKITKMEWGQEYDFDILPYLKESARSIIDKHKLDKEFLYNCRELLASKSLINEFNRSRKIRTEYIRALDDADIINLEDIHYIIFITNTFLYFLTGKEESVKQVLIGFSSKICPICGSGFKPRNREQITCGSYRCVKGHKNQLKKDKRKLSKISKN